MSDYMKPSFFMADQKAALRSSGLMLKFGAAKNNAVFGQSSGTSCPITFPI